MEPKICVNCKHCEGVPDRHICHRPVAIALDLVTGATSRPLLKPCRAERLDGRDGTCGPGGLFFEPKALAAAAAFTRADLLADLGPAGGDTPSGDHGLDLHAIAGEIAEATGSAEVRIAPGPGLEPNTASAYYDVHTELKRGVFTDTLTTIVRVNAGETPRAFHVRMVREAVAGYWHHFRHFGWADDAKPVKT